MSFVVIVCVVRSRNCVLGIQIKICSRCDRVATTFVELLFHLGIRIFNGSFATVIIWKENWTQNYLGLKKNILFCILLIYELFTFEVCLSEEYPNIESKSRNCKFKLKIENNFLFPIQPLQLLMYCHFLKTHQIQM